MTKPQQFSDEQIVRHDSPYQVDEHFQKGPQSGTGMLSPGRVVWTAAEAKSAEDHTTVHAFAEGIGVVTLEAATLRP